MASEERRRERQVDGDGTRASVEVLAVRVLEIGKQVAGERGEVEVNHLQGQARDFAVHELELELVGVLSV